MQKTTNLSIAKNITYNFIRVICGIIFPLISFPYAARVLGVYNIGKVNYCTSVINYFVLFAGLGISVYATREGAKYRDDRKQLSVFFKEILIINIVSTTISYMAFIGLVLFHVFDNYIDIIWISSMMVFFTTFSVEWIYQIKEEYRYITTRTVLFQFISFICLFCFVRERTDYPIYALITVMASGGSCFINLWHSRKFIDWEAKCTKEIQRHFKPILIIFGVSLSTSIYLSLDTVMIGVLRNDYEVGLYSAAVRLNSVVKTLITSISAVLLTRLSYYVARNNREDYLHLLRNGINSILVLVIPSSLGIIYLHNEVIALFCGPEFIEAGFACVILAVNLAFSVIDGMLYNQICLPNGLERRASYATFIGAISNFCLNLFFIKYWGYVGASITTLFSEVIVFLILIFTSSKVVSVNAVFHDSYYYFISAFVMLLGIWTIGRILYVNMAVHVIISVLTGGIIFFITLLIMKNPFVLSFLDVIRLRICKK